MSQWVVAPILVPALVAALMLLAGERRIALQRALGLASCLALGALAAAALVSSAAGSVQPYFLGDWPAPFGIVLVLDRLAAMMLAITAVVSLAALGAAVTGGTAWDARGRFFHPLLQFQLMGLNGAFLTGDLFNLFVFFEVLLIASYCLMLHGQGEARLRAGLHYVVVNLVASALFLVAVALLYSVTGTLNLADLALRVPEAARQAGPLVRAAALLLLVVFGLKAAAFPLYLWLPRSYAAAAAPVAALFALMTKVGVYSIVRVHGVVFGPEAGEAALVAGPWLTGAALATALAGVLGALAAPTLGRMAAHLTVASVGTLLIAVSAFTPASLGAALYYLLHSTLAVAALFLVIERITAERGAAGDRIEPGAPVGQPMLLGTIFLLAAAALVGLPPLSGFLGKVMILRSTGALPTAPMLWAVILATGLLMLVGLMRAGSLVFWKTGPAVADAVPRDRLRLVPALALLACGLALAVFAEPVKRYADGAAQQIADRAHYATRVLGGAGAATTRRFPGGVRPEGSKP
jgi:multicomponent K+:H+ antiporter subunit D